MDGMGTFCNPLTIPKSKAYIFELIRDYIILIFFPIIKRKIINFMLTFIQIYSLKE